MIKQLIALNLAGWAVLASHACAGNTNSDFGPETWEVHAQYVTRVEDGIQFSGRNEGARSYVRTVEADFSRQSFVAEATVTIRKGAGPMGIAYFGMGSGQPNPGAYYAPITPPSVCATIYPNGFGGGALAGVVNGQESKTQGPGDGIHRIRMTWDAIRKRAMFEMSANWDGKAFEPQFSTTVAAAAVAFTETNSRLFFGGGDGVSFSDFTVRPASVAEIKATPFGDSFVNDPSARTWLPVAQAAEGGADLVTAPVDSFLKAVGGSCRPLVCWYSGSQLAASRPFAKGQVETPSSKWTCDLRAKPTDGVDDALDFTASFKLTDGIANSAGVAMAFDFTDWSRENYVLVPAVIYDGNRFHTTGGGYNPGYPIEMYKNPRMPLTMSDNPRLSIEPGKPGKIELLTGNASTPAICFFSPRMKKGFILLTDQKSRFGNHGLFIEENAAQDRVSFVVSAPGVRERAAHFGGFGDSGDSAVNWKAADELSLRFRLYSFSAKDIPDLLEKFMEVREALSGPNQPRNLVPMSKLSNTIVPRFKSRWITTQAGFYYANQNNAAFQLGWVSGFMQTPMLAINDPVERVHMCKQMDFVISKLQGKSGFFYGGIKADGHLSSDGKCGPGIQVLTRKNADTLLMFFKQFAILKAQGYGYLIKPEWEQSARRLAQAFVKTWKKSGEFGQYLDPDSGEITIYNSTSGAIAPGGLALAARYFNDKEFLRVAKESAALYYTRDVAALGETSGHSGDTAQDPDADSAYGFLESIMALYYVTGDRTYLDEAKTVANLGATWTLSYDAEFPPQSQIARLGAHVAGAVWASAQNKHAAPGICTASGDYLFKLYRATGERCYAELIRDIQHAQVEATDMPGHPTCGAGYGASMERIQPTDGEGKGEIGNFINTQNAWTELDGLMMVTELPGIYLQTDGDGFYVFDHVEVKVMRRDLRGTTLAVTNPTKYDARVKIFAETAGQAQQPLSYTAYLTWPSAAVKAGETASVTVSGDGKLQPEIGALQNGITNK